MSNADRAQSKTSSSRRRFLKTTGIVAASSALAGVAVPRTHAANGEDAIKLAIVGCGGRGTGAVGNALSTEGGPVKLVAMADVFENRLEASHRGLQERFGDRIDVPPERRFLGFDAYKKAIDCLDPGDVVLLTTHAAFRPIHVDYAVEKGVNIFMEKSFAVDSPSTRRLQAANEKAMSKDLKIAVGFMWRHSKSRQEVIRRIHDGAIGDVHTLRIYRVHGPVHVPPKPEGMSELEFQIRNATRFNWASSGFFIDWHCHNIDVACWAKDAWPVSAQGMGGRCYDRSGNLFDHYTVEYTFEDGTKLFAFSRHMNNCWNTYSDYAHGAKGSAIIMTNLSQPKSRIYRSHKMERDQMTWEFGENDPNPYVVEWQVLLDAIRQGEKHNELGRACDANFAAIMGRAATHGGKLITWDEAVASDFQYVEDIDSIDYDSPAPLQRDSDGGYPCPQPGETVEI